MTLGATNTRVVHVGARVGKKNNRAVLKPSTRVWGPNVKQVTHMLFINTFTLGLVLAEGPPFVALLAHVSIMLGATLAGLGLAVRALAHVR